MSEVLGHPTLVGSAKVADRPKICAPGQRRRPGRIITRRSGSTGAVAAGALRLGNAVGSVLANRRLLGPVEARLTTLVGVVLCALCARGAPEAQ